MVSNAPRMISVVMGSAPRARRARPGRGRAGARTERSVREARRITPRYTGLRARAEAWQRDLVVHALEDDLDRQPDAQLLVRTADDVRVQPETLVELDDRDVVGHVVEERRVLRAVDDDERPHRAPPREGHPPSAFGQARGAEHTRWPAEVP